MANPPSVYAGSPMAANTSGSASASYYDTMGSDGATPIDAIGNAWGAGTTEGNFFHIWCSLNRIVKFAGNTYAWFAREVRKYNGGTSDWDSLGGIFPLSDMQLHYTGGGSPVTTYSFHSGLYVMPKTIATNSQGLFGFYLINGGFGGGTLAVIWSPSGDAGSWQKINLGITLSRTSFRNILVWNSKLVIVHDKPIIFDPETLTAHIITSPRVGGSTGAIAADFCIFKGKLVAISPRDGTNASRWSLFEWNGSSWTEKVSNLGSVNAGQNGSACLFTVNLTELIAFLPLEGSPYNYCYSFTEANGVYSSTDRTAVTMTATGSGGGYEHGNFPHAAHGHWQVHVDNWTAARVFYLFYTAGQSAALTYSFRYNGHEGLDPTDTDDSGAPPHPAESHLLQDVNGWTNVRRGEGEYTFEEGTIGDLGEVLLERTERLINGYRRVYFRVWGSGVNTGRVRIKWSPNQDTPETTAGGIKAVTGGGTLSIGPSEDYVDGVVNDGSLYYIDWDDNGVIGAAGKVSLAVAWGVA